MHKKNYFTPVLMVASGGIDITDSQEGGLGTGTVYDEIMGYLSSSLDSDALTWFTSSYGSDPSGWSDSVLGFDPNNSETWEFLLEFIYNEYYGG